MRVRYVKSRAPNICRVMCEHCHAVPYICGNPNEYGNMQKTYGDRLLPVLSVEEWIYYMKNTDYYFGDSYHGLCFSLIFHKPFIIVYRASGGPNIANERFRSLLGIIGMEERLLEDIDMCKAGELIKKPIDWEMVDKKLSCQREFSMNWLKQALAHKSEKERSVEELLKDKEQRKMLAMYNELNKKYDQLSRELEETKKQLAGLQNKKIRWH